MTLRIWNAFNNVDNSILPLNGTTSTLEEQKELLNDVTWQIHGEIYI